MIIYPSIFLWVYGQGMPKATRLRGSGDFSGHRYGLGVLKPATEPLIVFQKPYSGKPAEDMLATGSGALNIDGARVHGRWPANFIIVHSAECVMSGLKKGKGYTINRFVDGAKPFGGGAGHLYESEEFDDVYEDWNCVEGCPALELERQWPGSSRYFFNAQLENDPFALYIQKVNKTERGEDNDHPTLKPISLTTYLAKLLLPPDTYAPRRLLVPFSGAGSEVIGALSAGWEFVQGVEIVDAYAETSRKRIEEWTKKPMQGSLF
jgi:site-specific DNA-methyltransferase (adenine-specific)